MPEPGEVEIIDGPETVEVENIEVDSIDINNAEFDENDNVVRYYDEKANKIYVRKTESLPSDDDDRGADPAPLESKKTQEEIDAEAAKGTKDKVEPDTIKFANPVHKILHQQGYDNDEIELEGGERVKIADLTPDQQIEILNSELDNLQTGFDEKLKAASVKEEPEEFKFDDPKSQQILEFLKGGGKIEDLAKELLSKDPKARGQMLSDADVVREQLKKDFPEFTDEDLDAELKDMSDEAVARRAKAYRAKWEKDGIDISSLTEDQKAKQAKDAADLRASYEAESTELINKAKETVSIAGFEVNDQIKNYLLQKVIPKDENSNSTFLESINDPDRLLKLAFFDQYGDQLISKTADTYYKKGLKDAQAKGSGDGLEDKPIRTYGKPAQSGKNATPKVAASIDDLPAEFFGEE